MVLTVLQECNNPQDEDQDVSCSPRSYKAAEGPQSMASTMSPSLSSTRDCNTVGSESTSSDGVQQELSQSLSLTLALRQQLQDKGKELAHKGQELAEAKGEIAGLRMALAAEQQRHAAAQEPPAAVQVQPLGRRSAGSNAQAGFVAELLPELREMTAELRSAITPSTSTRSASKSPSRLAAQRLQELKELERELQVQRNQLRHILAASPPTSPRPGPKSRTPSPQLRVKVCERQRVLADVEHRLEGLRVQLGRHSQQEAPMPVRGGPSALPADACGLKRELKSVKSAVKETVQLVTALQAGRSKASRDVSPRQFRQTAKSPELASKAQAESLSRRGARASWPSGGGRQRNGQAGQHANADGPVASQPTTSPSRGRPRPLQQCTSVMGATPVDVLEAAEAWAPTGGKARTIILPPSKRQSLSGLIARAEAIASQTSGSGPSSSVAAETTFPSQAPPPPPPAQQGAEMSTPPLQAQKKALLPSDRFQTETKRPSNGDQQLPGGEMKIVLRPPAVVSTSCAVRTSRSSSPVSAAVRGSAAAVQNSRPSTPVSAAVRGSAAAVQNSRPSTPVSAAVRGSAAAVQNSRPSTPVSAAARGNTLPVTNAFAFQTAVARAPVLSMAASQIPAATLGHTPPMALASPVASYRSVPGSSARVDVPPPVVYRALR
eukprot:TRINITY_DN386_c0_g3_i1.p1 TRINITY_DN386_c0_g3~~TRINITY_DN386_c0_g3_i1.p1  ORF type:complete len:685 (+),score=148.24 TRINITY_DN386_c0_g3_i1:64-2055(+)